ncbi:MAG: T9SS type A sorting domain-containing protein [Calditrichaeota bacterium]|nr:T9SS type A sorting domain-containing protein [Candidatus Cloacimonadota bacterium]MCB1047372.1 T9SS type A sorting domain-containing protein [Calditrichota bacterium]
MLLSSTLLSLMLGTALPATHVQAAPEPAAPATPAHLPLIETGAPSREMIEFFRQQEKPWRRLPHSHGGSGLRDSRTLSQYDVSYYELELDMPTASAGMTGVVRMHFRSLEPDLASIELHAGDNLGLDQVLVNGQAASFSHTGDDFTVTLPQPLGEGESAVLETHYTVTYGGGGVLPATRTNVQTSQSVATLTTQAEPWDARRFWPCRDEPIDKADSLLAHITTQDYNTVVSNGVLRSNLVNGDGTRTVTWFEGLPMSTYLFSVCIAPYNHRSDTWSWNETSMPMEEWSWGLSPSEQQFVSQTGMDALTAFSDLFGLYPFHEQKYGHAQYTWGGAMEHQSVSSMGFYNQAVIAHELMHQWFGDKLTCESFHHIWLNEGWATYGEALFFESIGGSQTLHDYMDFEEYYGGGTIYVENPESENIFDGNLSYAKGAWVLHMLRHVMGDEGFFTAVRAYLGGSDPSAYRTVDTAEFQSFMEAEYGESLDWFFTQWIHGEYWPDYVWNWQTRSEGPQLWLDMGVVQRQLPERQLFTMPLDLVVYYPNQPDTLVRLFNDQPGQNWSIALAEQPDSVRLDPQNWVLSNVTRASDLDSDPRLVEVRILDGEGAVMEALPDTDAFGLELDLQNFGGPLTGLSAELQSTDSRIALTPQQLTPGALELGQTITLEFDAASLSRLEGRVAFSLELAWPDHALSLPFSLPGSHPSLILVDDDTEGNWEQLFLAAAGDEVVQLLSPAEFLSQTPDTQALLIWHQGNAGRMLSPDERSALESFVELSGHVVLSGQDLLQSQDPVWAQQFLGLEVIQSSVSSSAVSGEITSIFPGQLLFFINGGAGNQTHMDRLDPLNAFPVFHYFNSVESGDAGVVHESDISGGRVLSLGFGLEGISGAGTSMDLGEVLERLIAWSRGEVGLNEPGHALPRSPVLDSAWPNPFNPETRVSFTLPREGNVELMVYNLAGQLVDTLHRGRLAAGTHQALWRAEGRSSGVYLLRLDGPGGGDTMKVLLLK